MINPLKSYRILLVDSDIELSNVLKAMLVEMGFIDVRSCRSGKEAINLLSNSSFDFLITEWNIQHIEGLELLKYLRRDPSSPNPTLPVIMLTGRAELDDVFLARNYGINEYVVKPFTARSIYSRLERIIEHPRGFVVSKNFVGPDRRANSKPPEGVSERRVRITPQKPRPNNIAQELLEGEENPQFWLPDFSLKAKIGNNAKLSDFVTAKVINNAQFAIDAITHDSLQWIRDNLRELKLLNEVMLNSVELEDITKRLAEIALLICTRAGTFGYSRAGEIAYALYLFARNNLDPKSNEHHLVVQKHIEVLHVILGNQMRGNAGEVGATVAAELKSLVSKYTYKETQL